MLGLFRLKRPTISRIVSVSGDALHKTGVIYENALCPYILGLHLGQLSPAEATKEFKNSPD